MLVSKPFLKGGPWLQGTSNKLQIRIWCLRISIFFVA